MGLQQGQILHKASSKLDAPGAPIWVESDGRRLLVGIASSIFSKNSDVNWGCYLKEETRSQLMQWINEDFERSELEAGDQFGQDEIESLLASQDAESEDRTRWQLSPSDLDVDLEISEDSEELEILTETWPGGAEPAETEDLEREGDESEWPTEDSGEEEELQAPSVWFPSIEPKQAKAKPEIILVAGVNYPKFEQSGKVWHRKRQLSAGPWRQFCLTLAEHRLLADPNVKVTLLDFLTGTRENVTLDAKKKAVTSVEKNLTSPNADDYWNLVGIDWSAPTFSQVISAKLEPANKKTLTKKAQVSYFDGASTLFSGKSSVKLQDYVSAAVSVTSPVISITDVYAYIEGFAGSGKKGTLQEVHFLSHAFNIMTSRYSGGPILLNSLDNPFITDRHPLDKDARAAKDFKKPTMDPAVFAQAFATGAKIFIWGCNFQRGFIRQFVQQAAKNGKALADGRPMKISHSPDWGDATEFRARLSLGSGASVKNVSVDLAKVKQVLKEANQATYMQMLATASGQSVVGAPPGTYADYDGSGSPLRLLHVPMTGDPFRNATDSFEKVLLFFRDSLNFSFDTTFGNHNGLGRGYIIYSP